MKMITWDEGIYTSYNKLLHLGIYNYFLYNWNVLIYNKETAYRRVQDIEEQYKGIILTETLNMYPVQCTLPVFHQYTKRFQPR